MIGDEVVQTPFGKFLVNDQDLIESTLKAGTLWDGPGFLQVIAAEYARFGEPGTTIIDVGANVGSFSIYCASRGAWRVVAVEPVPSTMQRLKANLDLNKDTCAARVVTLEVAAYDRLAALHVPAIDPGNRGGTALTPLREEVPVESILTARPLDDFRYLWQGGVSLIKIDAQGCDGAALVGLEKTIEAYHPAIIFEWEALLAEAHGYSFGDILKWLAARGYQAQSWPSHPTNFLAIWDKDHRK